MLEKAKKQALKYILIRVRSEKEIKKYLEKKGYDLSIIDKTISYLDGYNYIDDSKFCEMWINDRILLRPSGRKKLYHELKEKGVKDIDIENALNLYFPREIEIKGAKELVDKKRAQQKNDEQIRRFLLYRGFSYEIIDKIIENNNINDFS